ncbi:unnamed protein product, partial [Cyprideis torosa]
DDVRRQPPAKLGGAQGDRREHPRDRRNHVRTSRRNRSSDEDGGSYTSDSGSDEDDDEPPLLLRARHSKPISYRTDEYDRMIKEAIGEESETEDVVEPPADPAIPIPAHMAAKGVVVAE